MSTVRRLCFALVAAVLVVSAFGCSSAPKPKELQKIVIAQSANATAFAPMYVAIGKGYFEEEGLKVEFTIVQGGTTAMAAAASGDAQFVSSASADPIKAIEGGANLVVIHGLANRMAMDIAVTKKFADRTGVKPGMPVDQVTKAMKGGTFGTASIGGAPDRYTRWLMGKYGFNPEKDINVIRIGGPGELLAAMKNGLIDGVLWGPELGFQAEAEGYGFNAIRHADVPEFKLFTFEVVTAKRDYLEKNPEIARKVARALAKANDLSDKKPEEAAKVMRDSGYFGDMSEALLVKAMKGMEGTFANKGLMSVETWGNAMKVMTESGALKTALDIKEGVFWTNQYAK